VKDKESKQRANHTQKCFVAAGETAIFALVGLVFPPAHIGWVVTGAEALRQNHLAIRDTQRKLKLLEKDVDKIEQKVDEHIYFDHEPIPPNPNTATLKEIEKYKKAVRDAGNKSQQR
jgi:uncharacterized membrane protein YciS (DUF1049 family)